MSSDPDLIQQFISIKNFDPSLVINPDSIYAKPMSNQISTNYIKVKLNFKTLMGAHFMVSSTSISSNDNFEDFIVRINGTNMPMHIAENYPLFSFDTEITFKNAEIIDYSKAVCQKTEIDIDTLTSSVNFTIHDIRFIILKDPVFISSLNTLGFYPIVEDDYPCLSLPGVELLNMVARKEWKLRTRVTNMSNYMSIFDAVEHWTTGNKETYLSSHTDNIYGFSDWVNNFCDICG